MKEQPSEQTGIWTPKYVFAWEPLEQLFRANFRASSQRVLELPREAPACSSEAARAELYRETCVLRCLIADRAPDAPSGTP